MENGVVNGGEKGKSQGTKGSTNANDVWVWMRPHIGFYTIGNCDILSLFLLIESLPTACKFYPLFLFFSQNMELFNVGVTSFLFNPCSFFLGSFFC
jgi:hypothetical protein